VPVYEVAMVVREGFLQDAYAAAEASYGSRDGYLRDGLGLDDRLLSRLRDRLIR
jgi:protein-tyrosine phosphatase